jgi:hypothetical protein
MILWQFFLSQSIQKKMKLLILLPHKISLFSSFLFVHPLKNKKEKLVTHTNAFILHEIQEKKESGQNNNKVIASSEIIIFLPLHISECPPATDGMERFACPTPDRQGRYRCIDDHVLCDGFIDCPEGADEDRQACMFYKTVS